MSWKKRLWRGNKEKKRIEIDFAMLYLMKLKDWGTELYPGLLLFLCITAKSEIKQDTLGNGRVKGCSGIID